MALVRAFHEVYGPCLVPESWLELYAEDWSTYDPAEHRATDVIAYLHDAGPRERARVLDLERAARRPRRTVLALDEHLVDQQLVDQVDAAPETPAAAPAAGTTTHPAGTVPGQHQED